MSMVRGTPTVATIAPRYLARFRCVGPACEDTCCAGMQIAIDDASLAAWDARLGAARVDRAVDRERRRLRVLDDGACTQLDGERLCAIHRELGEDALPDTCALFPRVLQRAGDRLEVTGSLSCPELARLALLADDAHALVELPPSPLLARAPHTRVAAEDAQAPWIALAPSVRDAIDRGLADATWTTATRLFAIARLGEDTRAWFHREAGAGAEARLGRALTAAFAPARMAALDAELYAAAPAAAAGAAIVADLLTTPLGPRTPASFHALLDAALAGTDAGRDRRASPASLWATHDERTAALSDDVLARLDVIDAAWARQVWRLRWHLFAPDLFAHGLLHLVGRALVRVLLAAHPRVHRDPDGAAIDVIHGYVRHFEHAGLHDQLAPQLRAGGLETRAVARSLLLV